MGIRHLIPVVRLVGEHLDAVGHGGEFEVAMR